MMAENDYVDDVKNTERLESLPRLALEICMSLDHRLVQQHPELADCLDADAVYLELRRIFLVQSA